MWQGKRGRADSGGNGGIGNVFGTPLEALTKRDQSEVPLIVRQICEHLSKSGLGTEGLFRISGNKRVMNQIRALFDEHTVVDFSDIPDLHSIAGVLKLYLRELPDGIVNSQATLEFVQAAESAMGDPGRLCRDYSSLIDSLLPGPNRQLLKYLAEFLRRVADRESENKMSPLNLGICFGPNVFRCADTVQGLKVQSMANKIMSDLVMHYTDVFETRPQAKQGRYVMVEPVVESNARAVAARRLSGPGSMTNNNSSVQTPQPKPRNSLQAPTTSGSNCTVAAALTSSAATLVQVAPTPPPVSASTTRLSLDDEPSSYSESPRYNPSASTSTSAVAQQMALLQQPGSGLNRAIRAAVYSHLFGCESSSNEDDEVDDEEEVDLLGHIAPLPRRHDESGKSTSSAAASATPATHNHGEEESDRTLTPEPTAVPRLDLSQLTANNSNNANATADARRSVYDNVGSIGRVSSHQRQHSNEQQQLSPNDIQHHHHHHHKPRQQQPSANTHQSASSISGDQPQAHQSVRQLQHSAQSLGRRLAELESRFLSKHGRRPSRADRAAEPELAETHAQLQAIKRQLKATKEAAGALATDDWTASPTSETPQSASQPTATPLSSHSITDYTPPSTANTTVTALRTDHSDFTPTRRSSATPGNNDEGQQPHARTAMEDTFRTLIGRLEEKRSAAGRSESLEQMDQRQIADEKLALQKALLLYENMHGRPHTKRDKDLMKPLYDRYRRVKKMLATGGGGNSPEDRREAVSVSVGATGATNNYATISIPSGGYDWSADGQFAGGGGGSRMSAAGSSSTVGRPGRAGSGSGGGGNTNSDFLVTQDFSLLRQTGAPGSSATAPRQTPPNREVTPSAAAAAAAANLALLTEEIRLTKEEKYKLQKMLKSFEHEFESQTGHKMAKVDRLPMQAEYNRYKNLKSKLKRLEQQLSQATL